MTNSYTNNYYKDHAGYPDLSDLARLMDFIRNWPASTSLLWQAHQNDFSGSVSSIK
jgi:hypothetical protein